MVAISWRVKSGYSAAEIDNGLSHWWRQMAFVQLRDIWWWGRWQQACHPSQGRRGWLCNKSSVVAYQWWQHARIAGLPPQDHRADDLVGHLCWVFEEGSKLLPVMSRFMVRHPRCLGMRDLREQLTRMHDQRQNQGCFLLYLMSSFSV